MFNGYELFLKLKYLFNSNLVNNFWICSSKQTISSVPFSLQLKCSLSSLRVLSETDQMKKVIYVFHSNRNSFDMIFITTYQPKIHKSNGLPKICFHRFYFNLIQDGYVGKGGGGKKAPPTRFSPVISTNIRLSLQNFLTFSFNSFDRLV